MYRYYYDMSGNYIGGLFDGDPIPPGWTTFTYNAPPSFDGPSIDNPNGPINPPIEKWSFINNNWYVPFTTTRLKIYRDLKIFINLEYNNGSTVFDVFNNVESYDSLGRIAGAVVVENSDTGTVMWKNLNGEYEEATYADMQSLFHICYRREQDCRNAESYVLAQNAITPYVDFADATTDFDNQL